MDYKSQTHCMLRDAIIPKLNSPLKKLLFVIVNWSVITGV